jgi:predicted dehydrogenase
MQATKKIAIAGTGTRALGFAKWLLENQSPYSRLVALYDLNRSRMHGFCRLLGKTLPAYNDFKTMLASEEINTLVICTPDYTHPELVEMAFANGLQAIVEKPMAMNREGVQRVQAAEERYQRKIVVTFNMRFMPNSANIKEIMLKKPVGRITSVNAEWFISRTHGIEYFHRWHGKMAKSGGLLVHKATHHFDLINWFVEDDPKRVFAYGTRQVFGDANPFYGKRCSNCVQQKTCWAAMKPILEDQDLNPGSDEEIFNELYFKAEHEDGYFRDGCCFARDIDIYDTMSVLLQYRNGVQVSYTENAYSPWQGYKLVFNGTEGRVEISSISEASRPANFTTPDYISLIKGTNRQNISMDIKEFESIRTAHGGGDNMMMNRLFGPPCEEDHLGQCAGSHAGAMSALIGIAANESIISGKPENI